MNPNKLKGEALLDWYDCRALEQVADIPSEINLLDEYLAPNEDYGTRFWMEPGDIVHLSASLALLPGHYLLKVSFYGTDSRKDFWSRQVHVAVA